MAAHIAFAILFDSILHECVSVCRGRDMEHLMVDDDNGKLFD